MRHLELAHGIVMLPRTKTAQATPLAEHIHDHHLAHARLEFYIPHIHVPSATTAKF